MLINIMVATVAADPTVALKPRDHLGLVSGCGMAFRKNICAWEDSVHS